MDMSSELLARMHAEQARFGLRNLMQNGLRAIPMRIVAGRRQNILDRNK
jgi:hypothetical protein